MVKEVSPDIFMITQAEKSRFVKFSVNVFVIAGADGLIFDAGSGKKRAASLLVKQIKTIENNMRAKGRKCSIARVLPSHGHWDHFSGIAHLRKNLSVRVLVTKKMLENTGSKKAYRDSFKNEARIINVPAPRILECFYDSARFVVDEISFRLFGIDFVKQPVRFIEENSSLVINNTLWEVIHLPGHCDDAIVLYNRQDGILLCGDNLLRSVTTWLGPPKSNLEKYIESLEYLLTLPNLKLILPAHGSPITEPVKRLKEAIDHRHHRTRDLLNAIELAGETGLSFNALLKHFYPKIRFYKKYIVRGWILTTLEYLLEKKKIYGCVEKGKKVFKIY